MSSQKDCVVPKFSLKLKAFCITPNLLDPPSEYFEQEEVRKEMMKPSSTSK